MDCNILGGAVPGSQIGDHPTGSTRNLCECERPHLSGRLMVPVTSRFVHRLQNSYDPKDKLRDVDSHAWLSTDGIVLYDIIPNWNCICNMLNRCMYNRVLANSYGSILHEITGNLFPVYIHGNFVYQQTP